MFCLNCSNKVPEDSKFCQFCGVPINCETQDDTYPKVLDKYKKESIDYPKKRNIWGIFNNIIHIFLRHWKKTLFIIVIGLIVWGLVSDGGIGTRKFPQLAEPKTITFEWAYNGSNYTLTETLYGAVYNYYNSNPEKRCWYFAPEEDTENCYREFLVEAKEDSSIREIALDIKELAQKRNLNNDELVELAVAFVQSIPYDDNKLEIIKSLPDEINEDNTSSFLGALPGQPYETLYKNSGVCSDKSFLATAILQELDYGTALFDYDGVGSEIGHMVPAIKCPEQYSSYNSGYCYIETTGVGYKIGEIPQMDINTGEIEARTVRNLFNENNITGSIRSPLKDVVIYKINDGNSYQGIITTYQEIQKIENIENELIELNNVLVSLKNDLNALEDNVNYYDQQAESMYSRYEISGNNYLYDQYLSLFSQYQRAYDTYEIKRLQYNREINKYNNLIEEYNILIEDF